MQTTSKLISIALNERKKSKSVIADSISEPIKNQYISRWILSATLVLIYGRPLTCTRICVVFSNQLICAIVLFIKRVRDLLLAVSLFTRTTINDACALSL